MMMDNSGVDSASDHSSHASSSSPVIAIKPSPSPTTNNNNIPSHHHHQHQVHSPRQASPLGPPMSMAHPLSPPPVTSASLARSMALGHLPPPGLGLLNSLGVLHNPLDLMAHHAPPRPYNSPPPISTSDPTANECKLVDYRGQKVAAFIIAGDTMLCLPQAFELFLKHLVGGLHTVYTKLKRLDIVPLVCNVEQVRILRGLGAIQPGVNRCKLLSCKDFDTLYKDCTTARPGRPPKRAPVGLSLAASHLQHQQLKKPRMDNGDYPYENGHNMSDMARLEKSPLLANGYNHPPHLTHMQFMQLPHPAAAHSALLSPAMPHNLSRHDGSIIKNQGMPSMEVLARSGIWENSRLYEDIVKHLERLREERCDSDRPIPLDQKPRDLSSPRNVFVSGSPDQSPVLNLSKSGGGSAGSLGDNEHSGSEADCPDVPPSPRSPRSAVDEEEDNISEPEPDEEEDKDQDMDDGDLPLPVVPVSDSQQAALNYSTLASAVASANGPVPDPGISSTETLLRNIQGLLKVAADNARQQERQINYEKAELKMDVLRERDEKANLEKQLHQEQKLRETFQKRLRREKRGRKRLQEQLDVELGRRAQLEEVLRTSGESEKIKMINDKVAQLQQHRQQADPQPSHNTYPHSVQSQSLQQPKSATPNQILESPMRPTSQTMHPSTPEISERVDRIKQEVEETPQQYITPRDMRDQMREQPPPPLVPQENKLWGYSGLDLINNGAAFWQNYSESLTQELDMERKSRQQQAERDLKSPLQNRNEYYKNSVMFTGTAT
ncbi:dachshund homolog 2 isoform X2 [Anthonomus grandis grandis]|uniref:dachshund homolog 2 isoform X2 n=1 Tax=Anthonomus grandis grandis TaxID=2921223 RepID=UPI002165CD2B|nr:dachshund homolog 2 isoform X2 [Anthonomus grandis grandis]